MAEDSRDMLLRIIGPMGPFPGECRAAISFKDPLVSDYRPGFYSDVKEFAFSVGLEDPGDAAEKARQKAQRKALKSGLKAMKLPAHEIATMMPPEEKTSAGFDDFRNGGSKTYPADLQPFSLTKLFDAASLPIFDACANALTLPTVSLVKRKAMGQKNPNDRSTLLGYMRFLFTEVLITDLDWDEDDVITEKIKFICRKVEVRYFPEVEGGLLDKTLAAEEWSLRNASQGGST